VSDSDRAQSVPSSLFTLLRGFQPSLYDEIPNHGGVEVAYLGYAKLSHTGASIANRRPQLRKRSGKPKCFRVISGELPPAATKYHAAIGQQRGGNHGAVATSQALRVHRPVVPKLTRRGG
jgi:hypothetical protein